MCMFTLYLDLPVPCALFVKVPHLHLRWDVTNMKMPKLIQKYVNKTRFWMVLVSKIYMGKCHKAFDHSHVSAWISSTKLNLQLPKCHQLLKKSTGVPSTPWVYAPWQIFGIIRPLLGRSSHDDRKWLITMVSFRPLSRVVPLANGLSMAYKWG